MFRENASHNQGLLFGFETHLSPSRQKELESSSGYFFYQEIFSKIEERDYSVLYSSKKSAPNSPVNQLVGAIVLKHLYDWTDKELFSHLSFNMETRLSLGVMNMNTSLFTARTFYNFKNRLETHHKETGTNLLENTFKNLTSIQLSELDISGKIQRFDSVQLQSNIKKYSRLGLLVEVLSQLLDILDETDTENLKELHTQYKLGGQKYVYGVVPSEFLTHLEKISLAYYQVAQYLSSSSKKYEVEKKYQNFQRVYKEHFEEAKLKASKEVGSDSLQSPNDPQASFHRKQGEDYQGYVLGASETAAEEGKPNLITDVKIRTNNTSDAELTAETFKQVQQITPNVDEFHMDGACGSSELDQLADQEDKPVTLVQTAISGKKAEVEIIVEKTDDSQFKVSCPYPKQPPVIAVLVNEQTRSHKAVFNLDICQTCPFKDKCYAFKNTNKKKNTASFYFDEGFHLRRKRHKNQQKIPKERKMLRAGVEATMRLFHRGENNNGKLKITGLFNTKLYGIAMAISINFQRIWKHKLLFIHFFALLDTEGLRENHNTILFLMRNEKG